MNNLKVVWTKRNNYRIFCIIANDLHLKSYKVGVLYPPDDAWIDYIYKGSYIKDITNIDKLLFL